MAAKAIAAGHFMDAGAQLQSGKTSAAVDPGCERCPGNGGRWHRQAPRRVVALAFMRTGRTFAAAPLPFRAAVERVGCDAVEPRLRLRCLPVRALPAQVGSQRQRRCAGECGSALRRARRRIPKIGAGSNQHARRRYGARATRGGRPAARKHSRRRVSAVVG